MRTVTRLISILCLALAGMGIVQAQTDSYEGQPSLTLANDKMQLTLLKEGGALVSAVLVNDPQHLNPMWNPLRLNREAGRPQTTPFSGIIGHFVAVNGFGQGSAEERAAGLPQHGETHTKTGTFKSTTEGNVTAIEMTVDLPIVQETFHRTFRLVKGENVLYVDSQLDNLLGIDMPVLWAEHATVMTPFLEAGVAAVYLSGTRAQTRDYTQTQQAAPPQAQAGQPGRGGQPPAQAGQGAPPAQAARPNNRRLEPGKDFTWPMAPGVDGKPVDLSLTPVNPTFTDHSATLMTNQKQAWIATINPKMHLVYGYIFKSDEYPWVQHWGSYGGNPNLVRGMEFSTMPYDVSRREVITKGPMFDTPTYRWLPAKSKIESHFIMFYTAVPEGLQRIDDVKLENGQITISDRKAGKQIVLAASRGL